MNEQRTSTAQRPLRIDVVSVQSQVVYGRVGNNIAVPTLYALGLSVAAVPTAVFSNIPHYPTIHGGELPIEWFNGYLHDLLARGALHALRAVLVGYLGNPAQAQILARWVQDLLVEHSDLCIIIDPVIGDYDHGIYIDERLVDAYRQFLLPLADGLTPNCFELAQLTGLAVNDIENVIVAARTLLTGRTQWVAVTSAAPDAWTMGEMQVVLVTRTQSYVITHPHLDVMPKGTGDLFCAALTGHWLNGVCLPEAAVKACEHVVKTLQQVDQTQCAELLRPPMASSYDNNEIHAGEHLFTRIHLHTEPHLRNAS